MSCVFLTNKSDFHRNIYSYLLLIITASCDGVTASSIRCCVVNIRMCPVSLHFSTLGWAPVPCPLPPPAAHRCVASVAYTPPNLVVTLQGVTLGVKRWRMMALSLCCCCVELSCLMVTGIDTYFSNKSKQPWS